MAGLDPAIREINTWIPGTSPGMTDWIGSGGLAHAGDDLRQGGGADAVAEIAEPLAGQPRRRPPREERVERLGEALDVEALGNRGVEASALEIAADIERIEPRHAADDADVAAIGPGAAVGAAGDANAEPLPRHPPALETHRDPADDVALHTLRL